MLSLFILILNLWNKCYGTHFTNEETETQQGEVAQPGGRRADMRTQVVLPQSWAPELHEQ